MRKMVALVIVQVPCIFNSQESQAEQKTYAYIRVEYVPIKYLFNYLRYVGFQIGSSDACKISRTFSYAAIVICFLNI